mgnify:CR=1 FL=1
MKKKFVENSILFDILAAYKKSEFSGYLSFYEYCQVNFQASQMLEVNEIYDQLKIEQSIRDNFIIDGMDGLDTTEGEA